MLENIKIEMVLATVSQRGIWTFVFLTKHSQSGLEQYQKQQDISLEILAREAAKTQCSSGNSSMALEYLLTPRLYLHLQEFFDCKDVFFMQNNHIRLNEPDSFIRTSD